MTRQEIAVFRKWQVDPEALRQHFDDVESHRPFYDFEYTLESASGAKPTVSSSGIPFSDDNGIFLGSGPINFGVSARALIHWRQEDLPKNDHFWLTQAQLDRIKPYFALISRHSPC